MKTGKVLLDNFMFFWGFVVSGVEGNINNSVKGSEKVHFGKGNIHSPFCYYS